MSNSKCFLQPFTVDRGWLTVFDLNLHNCHCMTCTTKELSSRGKESRMELASGQENCIEMVIGKKLEVPNPSYSRFIDFISGSDLSSTRVVSSCTDCIVVFAWLLNLEKCSVVGCEIWFSQHRWHLSEYGVFLMEAVFYSFQRGRQTLHLRFMPYIEGNANSEVLLVTHIP